MASSSTTVEKVIKRSSMLRRYARDERWYYVIEKREYIAMPFDYFIDAALSTAFFKGLQLKNCGVLLPLGICKLQFTTT